MSANRGSLASCLGQEFVITSGDGDQALVRENQILVLVEEPWFPHWTYMSMGRTAFLFKIRGGRWHDQYMSVYARGPIPKPDEKPPLQIELSLLERSIVVFELILKSGPDFDPANVFHTNAFAMGGIASKG